MNQLLSVVLLLMADPDITSVLAPILSAFDAVLFPILMAVLAVVGLPVLIKKGLALAKAEDENQKMASQKSLVTAVIAFVLIFVLVLAFKLSMPILQNWVTGAIGA